MIDFKLLHLIIQVIQDNNFMFYDNFAKKKSYMKKFLVKSGKGCYTIKACMNCEF